MKSKRIIVFGKVFAGIFLVVLVVGISQYSWPDISSEPENEVTSEPKIVHFILKNAKHETELLFLEEFITSAYSWTKDAFFRNPEREKLDFEDFKDKGRVLIVGVRWPAMVPEKYARRELDPIYGKNSFRPTNDSYDYMSIEFSTSGGYAARNFEEHYRKEKYENSGKEIYGLHDMGSRLWFDDSGNWSLPAGYYTRTYWPIERPEKIGFHMTCPVIVNYPATKCRVRRDITPYLRVNYIFNIGYLAQWKEIDNKVMDLTKSWMVNQEDKDMLEEARFK